MPHSAIAMLVLLGLLLLGAEPSSQTDATSLTPSLTAAKVGADKRVANASFAKKVNTAVLQVHTPGPSFLLFGFPKCGTTTLWAWITQHPKIKGKEGRTKVMKEIHSLDNGGSPRGEGQIDYDGWQPEEGFARKLPSSLAADEVSGDGTPWYSVYLWPSRIIERAALWLPRPYKLIAVLRNPMRAAWSIDCFLHRNNGTPLKVGPRGAGSRFDRRWSMTTDYNNYDYAARLRPWGAAFPRSSFLILRNEDLETNGTMVTQQVWSFLGLDASIQPVLSDRNVASRAVAGAQQWHGLTCPHNFTCSARGVCESSSEEDSPSADSVAHALRFYYGIDAWQPGASAPVAKARVSGLWQHNWTTESFVAPWWEDAYKLASWARDSEIAGTRESRD